MNSIIDAAVSHARTVAMLLLFIFVAGTASYISIPKESAPDVKIPLIYISVRLEGISPEDGERLLIRPLEKKLVAIESVKKMESHAQEGFVSVMLEFEAGFDSEKAIRDVRVKVDEAQPDFPQDAEEPVVTEVNFSNFPIINVILKGEVEDRTLYAIASNLRDHLEQVSEVLEAKISGNREEVLEVVMKSSVLEAYKISPQQVFAIIAANHILIPAGYMDTGDGRYSVKIPGLIESFKDLRNMPVKYEDGKVVTIKDVADIHRTFKDPENFARVNGQPAVVLGVSKRSGANIIETAHKIRDVVEHERVRWPSGVEVIYAQDTSDRIENMLGDLENNVILAVLLVLIVMILVMGVRPAVLVALSIPTSFLIGILCLAAFGMTLNIVVLFSLILAVGLLVDSAIVVTEYADRRMLDGESAIAAFIAGAKRMAWPVIASTVTTLLVFTPLLFWPGVVGQFMKYMPVTLIFTLTGSLLVAFVFLPTMGAWLGRGDLVSNDKADRLDPLTLNYVKLLQRVLVTPWRFIVIIATAVAIVIALFVTLGPGVEFFPDVEPENASVKIHARGNLSISQKDTLVRQVEQRIADMDEIRVKYARAGENLGLRNAAEDVIGEIQLEFISWRKRRPADEILQDIRGRVKDISGIIVETGKQEEGPPTGKALQVEFSSRIPEKLPPFVTEFVAALEVMGGFIDIENELPLPEIEWEMEIDRVRAAQYGIDVRSIGNFVKMVTNGIKVSTYRPDDADDEIDIIVRFPAHERTLMQLDRLRIYTSEGLVPISNFVARVAKQKTGRINRVDGLRSISVRADLEPGLLADNKVRQVQAWLKDNLRDPAINVTFRGEDEEQKEAGSFLTIAFMIALFSMALLLVTQFNSIYQMLVIMSAVFFSTGGVLLGLLLSWQPFGIVMCGVAIIALAGVVVNNNIIFIDTYNLLRQRGMDVREALLHTGAQRLRPILLTAGTTVLGLLPMVLTLNINFIDLDVTFGAPSSQWWQQLSTSIAGGLTFATMLTLFFTPCLLLLGERISHKTDKHSSLTGGV